MRAQTRTLLLMVSTAIILGTTPVLADGVMRPQAKTYPKDFLRHRMTSIDVTLHGQIAVTTVYQEFVNEWHLATDAVYSFPMPWDARATEFLFWSNDTLFRAPLKVKEQAPNPGTGEGGVDALLTNYLGPNGIRILLSSIQPGETQRVILKFISLCRYDRGRIEYRYPLNTDLFLTYPVDELAATFHVDATDDITSLSLEGMQDPQTSQTDARHAVVVARQSKAYLTKDLSFSYTAPAAVLGHDLYASKTASRGGHFVLMLKSPPAADSSALLPKNIVFMLDRSGAATGAPFQLGKEAILQCLDLLTDRDRFNVIAFNSGIVGFRARSVLASVSARDSAKTFLNALSLTGYANLGTSMQAALNTFTADSLNQAMIVFSDGMSLVSPDLVKGWNSTGVALFPVAISLNPGTARLETMAYQNFGFPMFLKPTDPVVSNVRWLFEQVSAPIIKDTRMEMGPNAFDLFPRELHTVYAGSRFFLTGRYTSAGSTGLTVAGQSRGGPTVYSTMLAFPPDSTESNFVESLWAKEKIDYLERRISLAGGATDSIKNLLINISLSYGIRCMYTAYVADKSQPMTDVGETQVTLTSFTATPAAEGVTLSWGIRNTARVREVHLYRADRADGEYRRIDGEFSGVMTFQDREGDARSAWYKLEVITLDGERILSDPVSAGVHDGPLRTELAQNYPNPFNPSTSIGYQVESPASVHVTILVYDMLGREVRSLVDASRTRGGYSAAWDGRDNAGTAVAAGMYICRLRAGEAVSTRTMLLLR
jgi:Ca-activated chloride channel homolog